MEDPFLPLLWMPYQSQLLMSFPLPSSFQRYLRLIEGIIPASLPILPLQPTLLLKLLFMVSHTLIFFFLLFVFLKVIPKSFSAWRSPLLSFELNFKTEPLTHAKCFCCIHWKVLQELKRKDKVNFMKDRKSEWKWTEKYDVFNLKRQTEGKGIVNFFLKREVGEKLFFFLLPPLVVSSFGGRERRREKDREGDDCDFPHKKERIGHDRVESTRGKSINSKTHLLLAFYPALQPTLEWMSEKEKQFHPWLHLLRFVFLSFLLLPNDFLMQQQLTLIARQVASCFARSSLGIRDGQDDSRDPFEILRDIYMLILVFRWAWNSLTSLLTSPFVSHSTISLVDPSIAFFLRCRLNEAESREGEEEEEGEFQENLLDIQEQNTQTLTSNLWEKSVREQNILTTIEYGFYSSYRVSFSFRP